MERHELFELLSMDRPIQVLLAISDKWKNIEWHEVDPHRNRNDYRHKPKSGYRPFTAKEMLNLLDASNSRYDSRYDRSKLICTGKEKYDYRYILVATDMTGVIMRYEYNTNAYFYVNFIDLLEKYIFIDGSRCGVKTV